MKKLSVKSYRFVVIGFGVLWCCGAAQAANIPAWWYARGLVNTQLVANDYAPANIGQLKNMAYQTWVEMTNQVSGVESRMSKVESRTNNWNAAYITATSNQSAIANLQSAMPNYVTGTVVRVETDPKVGITSTNYVPKWNGNALASGSIYDDGNVGIGTNAPSAKLDVQGDVKASGSMIARHAQYAPENLSTITNTSAPDGTFKVTTSGKLALKFGNKWHIFTSSDEIATSPFSDMVLIPAGNFPMGDSFAEGASDELPLHTNTISAFYVDPTEVKKAKWDEVYIWALANGYNFSNTGLGQASDHPVHTVNWYDCVKWANARSEKEGLTPCYTVGGSVYRTGSSVPTCNWTANGYRLPTEAEWEKAARGGMVGHRFPWSDSEEIQHTRANYQSSWTYSYDTNNPTVGWHPDYAGVNQPYTSPAGSFSANGYGLYDMAGNVAEWCWDWYDPTYYANSDTDPTGASSGSSRIVRGGSWDGSESVSRVACRNKLSPATEGNITGFRLVRRAL